MEKFVKKSFSLAFTLILICLCLITSFRFTEARTEKITIATKTVTADYPTIQAAINNATNGDTIIITSGEYYEHVIVNKTVTLFGENNPTIDGNNNGTVLEITADNVTITGFKLQRSGWGWNRNGIYVYKADNCRILNNFLYNNCHNIRVNCSSNTQIRNNRIEGVGYGIRLINSFNCSAIDNNVSLCIGGVHLQNATNCLIRNNLLFKNDQGVRLYSPCTSNEIVGNVITNNNYDGMIETMPENTTLTGNVFYHNNFVNNSNPFIYKVSGNIWDNDYPSGGNYWDRHDSIDESGGPHQNQTGSDGIVDTQYHVNNYDIDRFPLVHPYGSIVNLNTSRTYLMIQSAINAIETLAGHIVQVGEGTYYEHILVDKPLTLAGENMKTILDGGGSGTVLNINADNVSIAGFTIRNSGSGFPPYDCGIFLNHSRRCSISESLITNNRIGLYLYFSTLNTIRHNIIKSNSEYGAWLWHSGENILTGNNISSNEYNFGVFGVTTSHFNNAIDSSNTADGKPIKYVVGCKNEVFDNQEVGALYLINTYNVTVQNMHLTKSGHAIFCFNTTNSRIENVTATSTAYGVYLQSSHNNTVANNKCISNWVGFGLQDSTNNLITNNYASLCEKGISLYKASNNIIQGNTLQSNDFGVRLYSAHLNKVFHNNLIQNTDQISLIISFQNVWDNGVEGNFWSNYNGSDGNRDGIGEAPQLVDTDEWDEYPLLGRYFSFVQPEAQKLHNVSIITNSTLLAISYDANDRIIRIQVDGTEGTCGFCRVSVPYSLITPELSVMIDNGTVEVLFSNYSLLDDGSHRWIYIEYLHSVHQIVIIPEYISLVALTVLVLASISTYRIKKML